MTATIIITKEMLDNVFPANTHELFNELEELEQDQLEIAQELESAEQEIIAKWNS